MEGALTGYSLSARSFAWRLHCAQGAIEDQLRAEAVRLGAARAVIVTSPSIAARTDTVTRAERALGELHAGTYAAIGNDSTFASVAEVTSVARRAGADLIVAIGGGSVIVAVRSRGAGFRASHAAGGRVIGLQKDQAEAGRPHDRHELLHPSDRHEPA